MAEQKQRLSDKEIRSLMPQIDIEKLNLMQNEILIYHQEAQGEDTTKSEGGIILDAGAVAEAKMRLLTNATIVKLGPVIENPGIKVGMQAVFFRGESDSSIKGTDGLIYTIFREYNLKGFFETPPVQVTPAGDITNL